MTLEALDEPSVLAPALQIAWYHRHACPRCTLCDRILYARITCASHASEADCPLPSMLTCTRCREL